MAAALALCLGAAPASALELSCVYTMRCQPVIGCSPEQLETTIMVEEGAARVIEGADERPATVHSGPRAVSVFEFAPEGQALVTTIEIETGRAVYSRHPLLSGQVIPSQYLGACGAVE